MITMQSVNWVHEGWELQFAVHEGVYHLEHYSVRISHLAFTEDAQVRSALTTVVTGLLRHHMRSGAIAPHAMVLDWSRAHRICEGGSAEIIAACQVIEATTLAEVGGAISNHF
jgi:hypothetical protein